MNSFYSIVVCFHPNRKKLASKMAAMQVLAGSLILSLAELKRVLRKFVCSPHFFFECAPDVITYDPLYKKISFVLGFPR